MARCDACGSTILFGGRRVDGYRFCNQLCECQGMALFEGVQVSDEAVAEFAAQLHQGPCPLCGGEGPVDVHTSHWIWSALVLTSFKSTPEVCCQGCGTKSKLKGAASSFVLGWWGMPFGLLITPVQVVKNLAGLASAPDPLRPSEELLRLSRFEMVRQAVAENPIIGGPPPRPR